MTTISSREFNQHVSRAKRAADDGPVVITDRGEPAYVLLKQDEYRRLTGTGKSILEMLYMPEMQDIDFEPERIQSIARPIDFDALIQQDPSGPRQAEFLAFL